MNKQTHKWQLELKITTENWKDWYIFLKGTKVAIDWNYA